MKAFILSKLDEMGGRSRARLVEVFGIHFFKRLSDSEWSEARKSLVTEITDITSKEELVKFVSRESQKSDYGAGPSYRVYLVPDYQSD